MKTKEIFVVAGENSGDLNVSHIINNLLSKHRDLKVTGIGGDNLKTAGANLLFDYSRVNFMGFYSVIKNYFPLKSIMNECIEYVKNNNPEIVLLVDFPGFNIRFASKIRKFYKGEIIYYILPQLWAWHKSRIEKLKKYFNKLLVVFPFEVDFYKKENLEVHYVGHPLFKLISDYKKTFGEKKYGTGDVIIMPGSRQEEFDRIFPVILETVYKIKKNKDIRFTLLKTDNITLKPDTVPDFIKIVTSANELEKYKMLYEADLVITKIGTSSFECAMLGTPFIPVYRAGIVNYLIAKRLITLKSTAMINILAGKMIVKEFIQSDFTSENLYKESMKLLNDINYRENILNEIDEVLKVFSEYKISKSAENIIFECLNF